MRGPIPSIVGRKSELDQSLGWASRPPVLVLIEGEAGMGKTRLVEEFCRQASGSRATVVGGRCHGGGGPLGLEPVVEALRQAREQIDSSRLTPVAGVLRELLPELSAHLPQAPPDAPDAAMKRHQIFRGLRELVESAAPITLVLEDLQWADDMTLDFLQLVIASPLDGLNLVLTYRPEELTESGRMKSLASHIGPELSMQTMRLGPLDGESVATIAREFLNLDPLGSDFLETLQRRSCGIPGAVIEFLRALEEPAEAGEPVSALTARLANMETPAGIRTAVERRLLALHPDNRALVEAAAILGHPISAQSLAKIAGLPEANAIIGIREPSRRRLLIEDQDGRVAVPNELLRRAIFETVQPSRRLLLHREAARQCEEDGLCGPSGLAAHFRDAGATDQWIYYSEVQARAAAERGDRSEEFDILQELLRSGALPVESSGPLALRLGELGLASERQPQTVEILEWILHLQGEDMAEEDRAEIRLMRAYALLHLGKVEPARDELQQCLNHLGSKQTLAALAMRTLAYPDVPLVKIEEHLSLLERAERIAKSLDSRDVAKQLQWDRAAILLLIGDRSGVEKTESLLRQDSPISSDDSQGETDESQSGEEGHPYATRVIVRMAEAATVLGHYELADRLLNEGRRRCLKLGFLPPLATLEAIRLLLDWNVGKVDGLEEQAVLLFRKVAHSPHGKAACKLVEGLARLGRAEAIDRRAKKLLAELVRSTITEGALILLPKAAGALARAHLFENDDSGAMEACAPALAAIGGKQTWVWGSDVVPATVEAMIRTGQLHEAKALTEEFRRGVQLRDAPAAKAALAYCEGLVEKEEGQTNKAVESFDSAAEQWAKMPRPYWAALSCEMAGRALLDVDEKRALERLTQALAIEKVGGKRDGARIRRIFRQRGVPMGYPWRGGRRSLGNVLSAREKEILDLVAEGRTYRDIGDILSLSPRTVEGHVARARRKQIRPSDLKSD